MLAVPVGDDRPEHRKPEQQNRREFVGPIQRVADDIAGEHAKRQDDDFDQHEERGGRFDDRSDCAVDRRRPGSPKREIRRFQGGLSDLHVRYASLFAYFSSADQAGGPNSAFQRW